MTIQRLVILALLLICSVGGTPMPQRPHKVSTCPSAARFGVPKRAIQVRGGDVLEAATPEEMEAILIKANGNLVVIDHWAAWCGPCKMIAPLFSELSEQIDDVVFVKVDVDENPDTAAKYSVSAMPTFVFVKNGEVVDRLMGANPERLKELIEEHK
jgi:thioredoxin 1